MMPAGWVEKMELVLGLAFPEYQDMSLLDIIKCEQAHMEHNTTAHPEHVFMSVEGMAGMLVSCKLISNH